MWQRRRHYEYVPYGNRAGHRQLLAGLGLGIPAQEGEAVEMTDSIKYYHDENENVFVPKRSLKDVII